MKREMVTGVIIPLMVATLSGVVSWQIARNTTKNALQEQVADGQAVFDSIGYLYFGAIVMSYDHGTGTALDDPQVWRAYRSIMMDIVEDIRWLRTNPVYADVPQASTLFPFLQNLIVAEAVGATAIAPPGTISLMCEAFVRSGRWEVPSGVPRGADILELAERLCRSIGQ